jgi:hypothetical protein
MQKNNPALGRWTVRLLLGALAPCLTGCVTPKFWGDYEINRHYAATDPKLAVYEDTKKGDELAVYDEVSDKDSPPKRRAFYLLANEARMRAGKKPVFVNPKKAGTLPPVPIGSARESLTGFDLCVVVMPDQHHFTLVARDQEVGQFELPSYPDRGDEIGRFLLLPAAVAGDAVVVGSVAGLYWLGSQAPGLPTH